MAARPKAETDPGVDAGTGIGTDQVAGVGEEIVPGIERSIAFSVEELVALARVTRLTLPVLGPNPLGHVRLAERNAVLDSATRSLRARNVIMGTGDGAVVPAVVRSLLEIVSASVLRAVVLVDGGATFARRYHAVPYASVEHEVDDGLHRFTPFATEDLLARIARQVGLTRRPVIAANPMVVPFGALGSARVAAAEGLAHEAINTLADAGMPEHVAASLAAALAAAGITVAVRITYQIAPTTLSGGELCWLDAGDAGLWLMPTIDQPFAQLTTADASSDGGPDGRLDDGLDDAEVEVTATDADSIASALFGFLPANG